LSFISANQSATQKMKVPVPREYGGARALSRDRRATAVATREAYERVTTAGDAQK
jgi:hypothetical protein